MIDNETLKSYYEKGWELGLLNLCNPDILKTSHFKFRILAVVDLVRIEASRGYSILDVGCGVGTTSILISLRYPNTCFTCVDISKIQIDAGSKYVKSIGKGARFEFVAADVRIPFPAPHMPYDYVIACEIIEHIPEPQTFLENLRFYGNDSTRYIFSVPIGKSRYNNICYRILEADGSSIVIDDPSKIDGSKESHIFYHKLYQLEEAKHMVEKSGYRIIEIIGSNFLASNILGYYIKWLSNYSYRLDKWLCQMSGNRLAGNMIMVCER